MKIRLRNLAVFLLLIGCLTAQAEQDSQDYVIMKNMASQLECRANFVIDLLESYFYYYAPAGGYDTIDQINLAREKVTLGYELGDFEIYTQGKDELYKGFENAKGLLFEIKKISLENKPESERNRLSEEMMFIFQRKSNYLENCLAESLKVIIKKEIEKAREMISFWYDTAKGMEKQGYKTKDMMNTINDASIIIDEFEYRINTERMTREMLENTRKQEWEKIIYYRAKFHALRLQAYAEKIYIDYPNYKERIDIVYTITNEIINDENRSFTESEAESAKLKLYNVKKEIDSILVDIEAGKNE